MNRLLRLKTCTIALLASWLLVAWPAKSVAHPHMWIQAQVEVGFNAEGQVAMLTQTWLFDDMFSSYARQGLAQTGDGLPDPDELAEIGQSWIEALADPMSHYFTTVRYRNQDVTVADAQGVRVQWHADTDQMSLQFDLPLLRPFTPTDTPLTISVADPTFFVAYSFDEPDAVGLLGAPSSCQSRYQSPKPLDRQTAQRLAAIPADATLPDDLMEITQTLQHQVLVQCL